MLARRHFEVMVFTYLVGELRWGISPWPESGDFGDWTTMLLSWEQVERRIP
jgi:hypothetical protein